MPPSEPLPPALPFSESFAKARKVRALGWLLVVLGLGLSIGMGWLAFWLHRTILQTDLPGSHSRWNGGPEFTRATFKLFGSVFVFGVLALLAGVYQIRTGRRSLWLVALILLAALAIVFLGSQIMQTQVPTH